MFFDTMRFFPTFFALRCVAGCFNRSRPVEAFFEISPPAASFQISPFGATRYVPAALFISEFEMRFRRYFASMPPSSG